MFAHKKIIKEKGAEPEPFEVDVAQAICDLEANSNDLKAELRELYIVSAKEVDVAGRKAVVIFVPFKLLKIVHKIQSRLVREVRSRLAATRPTLLTPPTSPPSAPATPRRGASSRCCAFARGRRPLLAGKAEEWRATKRRSSRAPCRARATRFRRASTRRRA